ncbi:MAG: porin family protein [Lutibacter sp.]|nr:porin family protein [Lutibacter sp.]MDP3945618.1 porin family protein [Lutibacter sp.]
MNKYLLILFFLFYAIKPQAQVNNDSIIDLKYLEDQLYLSLTYTILSNKPETISQNGFSGGFSMGFIKDIPLNEQRNLGLGIGVGYAYNVYVQNLKVSRENQTTLFELAEDYKTNRFGIKAIEMPFEFRWRTSTPEKYNFWRVYGGIKFAYLITAKTKFTDSEVVLTTKNIPEFNRIQYGATLATGYGNWNLYFYYGLSPLFKDALFNGKKIDLKDVNIGLKFYIM